MTDTGKPALIAWSRREVIRCDSIIKTLGDGIVSDMVREERAMFAAIEPALLRDDWRGMDSAPRDGTVFIVPGGVAHWHNGYWKTLTGYPFPGRPIEWEVKHWRPLPAPPEET